MASVWQRSCLPVWTEQLVQEHYSRHSRRLVSSACANAMSTFFTAALLLYANDYDPRTFTVSELCYSHKISGIHGHRLVFLKLFSVIIVFPPNFREFLCIWHNRITIKITDVINFHSVSVLSLWWHRDTGAAVRPRVNDPQQSGTNSWTGFRRQHAIAGGIVFFSSKFQR